MNARRQVQADIQACVRKCLQLRIIQNPRMGGNFFNDDKRISSKYTFFSDEEDYREKYSIAYERDNYLAVLSDGAYFQINYLFDIKSKNKSFIKKMNLCYIPNLINNKIVNPYLRIDYDKEIANSFFHPIAHLHIGFNDTLRIPLNEIMYFSDFCKMILYFYYQEDYKKLVNDESKFAYTLNTSLNGKITDHKILSKELQNYLYLKVD